MTIDELLETAANVQRDHYGVDISALGESELRAYQAEMLAALHGEVAELGELLPWRWWSDQGANATKQDVSDEVADVLIFLANICLSAGVTPLMIWEAWRDKVSKNADRRRAAV